MFRLLKSKQLYFLLTESNIIIKWTVQQTHKTMHKLKNNTLVLALIRKVIPEKSPNYVWQWTKNEVFH